MLRQGLRRLGIIFGALIAATVVVSALLGLIAGDSVQRAISIGLYVDGIALLGLCFVFGARGPLRGVSSEGETVPLVGAKWVRRASTDERSEDSRIALAMFVFGIVIVILGSLIDPAHKAF